jgi:regulator of protease activity HflC (stomatin/prohibitin superfamily)
MDLLLLVIGIVLIGVGAFAVSFKIANQWQRAVVLTLGKFSGVYGPGVFFVIPVYQEIATVIDTRILSTQFNAESAITKDTVPVKVDAVLFWKVTDVQSAALNVSDYESSILLAAQTALRDIIGNKTLAEILTGRQAIDNELVALIEHRIRDWGIDAMSVEIRDVVIPENLEAAMSQQAQAMREREARVTLSESEIMIADNFAKASEMYEGHPNAMHLRGMNMAFEALKANSNATIVMLPTSALNTMNLGATMALTQAHVKGTATTPEPEQ